jgi:hypothetical protein
MDIENIWTGRTPYCGDDLVDCPPSGSLDPDPLGHRSHVLHDEAALRPGRHDPQTNAEVLLRHRVRHSVREVYRRLFEQGNSHPLARAVVPCEVIPPSLGDEVEGAAIPAAEAIRLKGLGVLPESWVAVRSIHVQHDPGA